MTGATQDEYANMMLAGGRSVEGNRSKSGTYDKPVKKAARPAAKKASAKKAKSSAKSKTSKKRK